MNLDRVVNSGRSASTSLSVVCFAVLASLRVSTFSPYSLHVSTRSSPCERDCPSATGRESPATVRVC